MKLILLMMLMFCLSCATVNAQTASCSYNTNGAWYICSLTINNPNGFENFTTISGTHSSGKSDSDVNAINTVGASSNTPTFPSIVCEKFPNVINFHFHTQQLKQIGENSFRNCKFIKILDLYTNAIEEISREAFASQETLQTLTLYNNKLTDLPRGVFGNLNNLTTLYIYNNNISSIHSDSFPSQFNLLYFRFHTNNLNAFDERIIDRSKINQIDTSYNPCSNRNGTFTDNTEYRVEIRAALQKCFENYVIRCEAGDILSRVCQLERQNYDTNWRIDNLEGEKTDVGSQIQDLEERVKVLEFIILRMAKQNEDLQKQIKVTSLFAED